MGLEGVERRRNKAKELSKTQEFEGMCAPDNWRNTYSRVNSLHSGHSLEHQIKNMKAMNSALNDEYVVYDPNLSRSMIINESMLNQSVSAAGGDLALSA